MTEPAAPNPSLAIIMVSYNTREMTLACLRSVFEQTRVRFRLIVVDNASTDGSADAIAAAFPGVELIALHENIGFARANNLAASRVTEDLVLLLNPDTVVLDHAIDALVSFACERADAGIWGGRTRFADGSLNPSSCWARVTPWSVTCRVLGLTKLFPNAALFNPEAFGGWRRDTVRRVDIVSGCFFLIRRSVWEQLGGFDEAFFMYGEEADLCLRARALGCDPVVTPDAEIVHHGGASERHRSDKAIRLLAAKITLIRRHWPARSRWYGVGAYAAWAWARGVVDGVRHRSHRVEGRAHGWHTVWRRRSEWRSGYPSVAD
ncbi:MAG: glycosyltransferase family 2 protein [Phycisphaerales bacterium]